MKYRPDIDGLRAIAVFAVIFYHAHFTGFGGGFIGVDIFFVISGFLITGILLRAMGSGTFSYANFYERRARRILPALFTVILASIPLALLSMLTAPFEEYADTILSSVLFYSNFYFWDNGGYWGGDNALKPLLHTWSLAVEEQYYIIFPPLLLLCLHYARKHLTAVFIAGFALSLCGAIWASYAHPLAAFFLLPTRAFEILGGAILAKLQHENGRSAWRFERFMPALGAALILVSVLAFKDTMFHPSLLTLLPVLGAMLIIWFGGKGDSVSKILSSRFFAGAGLISYSLYLWHHILFSFARIKTGGAVSEFLLAALIVLTIVLSYLSWRFIETPFRDKGKIPRKKFWIIAGLSAFLLCSFALISKEMNGVPARLPPLAQLANAAANNSVTRLRLEGKECHNRTVENACDVGRHNAARGWVLLGDSHFTVISAPFWDALEKRDEHLITYINDGCFYAPGLEVIENGKPAGCGYEMNMQRREKLLAMAPQIIVLGGRMPLYLSGDWFDNGEGGVENNGRFYMRPHDQELPEDARKQTVKDAVLKGIRELLQAGHKVVLVYPIPEVGVQVPQAASAVAMSKSREEAQGWMDSGGVTTSYDVYKARSHDSYALYDALGEHPNLLRVYPDKIFCNTEIEGRCMTHGESGIYYADDDHLSLAGGHFLVEEIMAQIKRRWGI